MTASAGSSLRAMLRRLRRDDRGIAAILVALTLAGLIGIAGLGAETGLWYAIKRQQQSAADVAALSGAFELLAGQSYTDLCGFAQRDAARGGFAFSGSFACPSTTPACTSPASGEMCANNPPVLGTFAGKNTAVEVILAQQQNTSFASLFLPSVTIDTRAVAHLTKLADTCILALKTTGTGIQITGNVRVNTPNCIIAANSTKQQAFNDSGNICIQAFTLVTPGNYSFTGNSLSPCTANGYDLTTAPKFGAAPIADPYASKLTHTFMTAGMPTNPCNKVVEIGNAPVNITPGNCVATGINLGGNHNPIDIGPNIVFSQGLSIGGNSVIDLQPGVYWFDNGDFNIGGNSTLECSTCTPSKGVTLIFTSSTGKASKVGTLTASGNLTITLNAPDAGTYSGLLMIQDPISNGTSGGIVGNTKTNTLNGLVYFPNSQLPFTGNVQTSANCLVMVADSFDFTGNMQLTSTGCPASGLDTVPQLDTVELAE